MKFNTLHTVLLIGFLCLIAPFFGSSTEAKDFIVVIDAGHGGHDPGAIGKKGKEKNINLNVALKVGKLIENNCKGVKVIYTRKKDVFVTLNGRAKIANDAKADLFISIHTNSVARGTVKGAETYTLGLHRTADNLEVAKRENSVILIEDNYQQRYAGFNPNSSESYIIFELIQDKHMKKSVRLATLIQNQFRSYAKRIDKGVHQAGFLVLRETYMPSVLVELGYISTPEEERYLLSDEGSSALANSIYKAFVNYKREHDVEAKGSKVQNQQEATIPIKESATIVTESTTSVAKEENKTNQPKKTTTTEANKPVFMVQFLTSSTKIPSNSAKFKGLSPVSFYQEKGVYKYTYCESTDYNKVYKASKQVQGKFKDAFIVAFKNGEKINVHEAINEFKDNK